VGGWFGTNAGQFYRWVDVLVVRSAAESWAPSACARHAEHSEPAGPSRSVLSTRSRAQSKVLRCGWNAGKSNLARSRAPALASMPCEFRIGRMYSAFEVAPWKPLG